jgi:predicted dehydrogenase
LDDLTEVGVDGIVIATPGALQAEQAIAALGRGKAIFCGTRSGNREETRRIIEAARAINQPLGEDFCGTKGSVASPNRNGFFDSFTVEDSHGTRDWSPARSGEDEQSQAVVEWAKRLARGEGFSSEAAAAQTLGMIHGNSGQMANSAF